MILSRIKFLSMSILTAGLILSMVVFSTLNGLAVIGGHEVTLIYFFEKPISCQMYLTRKDRLAENPSLKSYNKTDSLFFAKIEIVSLPSNPSGRDSPDENVMNLRVLEELEGRIPGQEFLVNYPEDLEASRAPLLGKSYFIMGVVLTKPPEHFRNSKDITLLPLPLKEIQPQRKGLWENFWGMLPAGWFSGCKNLR